jgi:hypothetical protein
MIDCFGTDYVAAWALWPYIIAILPLMISCRRTRCAFYFFFLLFLIVFCCFFADWRLQQKALQELFD